MQVRLGAVALAVMTASGGAWAADPQPICNPDKLYDILSSSFHQTAAQLADDRGWAGWGQQMGGDSNVAPPRSIMGSTAVGSGTIGAAFPSVKPLLVSTASNTTNHQTVALGNDGKFYAWGVQGTLLPESYTTGVAVQGTDLELPAGVAAGDVEMLFASYQFLSIVANGHVWVLTRSAASDLHGDGGSTSTDNGWHKVKTDASTDLENVIAVRGQTSRDGIGAVMALTADGDVYTWGSNIYDGNGVGRTSNGGTRATSGYAALMTLPTPAHVSGGKVVQIGVTGGFNTAGNTSSGSVNHSYYVLFKADNEEAGELWSLGANTHRQLGTFNNVWTTAWKPVLKPGNPDGTGTLAAFADVKMFSVQEHDWGYAGTGSVAAIDTIGDVYTWGSNNGNMIGADGDTETDPKVQGGLLIQKGSGQINARYVEVGGHTTAYSPQNSPKFCYVGHKIAGSMGDRTDAGGNPWQFNCEQTPAVNICGAESIGATDDALTAIPVPDVLTELTLVDNTQENIFSNDHYRGAPANTFVNVDPGVLSKVTVPATPINWGPVPYLDTDSGKVYAPAGTSPGSYTITYEICDVEFPDQICAAADITVDILGIKAIPDTDSTLIDTPVTTLVTGNDTAPSGVPIDPESVTVVSQPPNGEVMCFGDSGATGLSAGECQYTPKPHFTGTDTYTYQVCNEAAAPDTECDTTTVTIAVGEPPTVAAYDDTGLTEIDVPLTTSVLANDVALGGVLDPASVQQVGDVTGGPTNATVNTSVDCAAGYCTFESDTAGTYQYSYEVCLVDPNTTCDTATVTVVVAEFDVDNGVKVPTIVPSPDSDSTPVNTPVTTTVVSNDNAVAGVIDAGSVTPVGTQSGKGGTIAQDGNGKIKYTPPADFVGTDTYQYEVCLADPNQATCGTTTVTIKVGNPAITAEDDTGTVTPIKPNPVINVMENDTPVGGVLDPTSVKVITNPGKGSTTVNPDGTVTYTPDGSFDGTDEFEYQVCLVNPKEACATAKVTIDEQKVIASDDNTSTAKDTPVSIPVLDNDHSYSDEPLDPRTVEVTSGPSQGTVTRITPNGVVTYTPNPGVTGTDTFEYQVCDATQPVAHCDTATVTVDIKDQAVVANDDETSTPPSVPVEIPVLENDVSTGDPLDPTTVVPGTPENGTVSCNAAGICTFTPDASDNPGKFTYEVCNTANPAQCDTAEVIVNVQDSNVVVAKNDRDVSKPNLDAADNNTAVTDVLDNDVSYTGSPLAGNTVKVTVLPGSGDVTVDPATGVITYTPAVDFIGEDSYRYEVCDSSTPAICDEAKVTILVVDIAAANDRIIIDPEGDQVDGPKNVLENDTVVPGPGVVTVTENPEHGTVTCTAAGQCSYTPEASFPGGDEFTYKVCLEAYPDQCATAVVDIQGTPKMVPVLDLPPPMTGKTYPEDKPAGTLTCTNEGTALATGVTCGITGLPPGLELGQCVNGGDSFPGTPENRNVGIGAVIECPIVGKPTGGPGKPTGTTGWEVPTGPSSPPAREEGTTGAGGKTPGSPVPVLSPAAVPVDNPFALILLALGLLGLGTRYARKRNAA